MPFSLPFHYREPHHEIAADTVSCLSEMIFKDLDVVLCRLPGSAFRDEFLQILKYCFELSFFAQVEGQKASRSEHGLYLLCGWFLPFRVLLWFPAYSTC